MSTKYEYYDSGDTTQATIYDPNRNAQTFTVQVGEGHYIGIVKLKVFRVGSPGTATVDIHETTADVPSGDAIATGTFDGDSVTDTSPGEWVTVTITSPYLLTESTKYAIVMHCEGDASNYIQWRADATGSYADGNRCYSDDTGSSWSGDVPYNTQDLMFEEWSVSQPSTPTNSAPADEATSQSITPTLSASAFSDEDGEHYSSQWQISTTSGDYSSTAYDSGADTTNLENITVPSGNLSHRVIYYWHVRYKSDLNLWSEYSTETSFTTVGGLEGMASGLKTRLQTITDINHVYASNELPNAINEFPAALILPGETEYNKTFTNKIDVAFRILVIVSKQDNPSALNRLLDYMEPTGSDSVYYAIDSDTTLGGAADDCIVSKCSGAGAVTWGGHVYLGTEFEILAFG